MTIRLNKYLASIGIASRRKIDDMISAGKIKVNEQLAIMGQKIDPEKDKISLNDQLLKIKDPNLIYILLNKPKGYISSTKDEENRPTILELVHITTRLYPIGRLDYNSEGLIILTNDGDLTQKLTHPKYHVEKTYIVDIFGIVTKEKLEKLANGIELEDGQKTKPAKVRILKQANGKTTLEFIISEGKKRQIRRMCSAVRFHILKLVRTKIGTIELGTLKSGKWRRLSKQEVEKLKK